MAVKVETFLFTRYGLLNGRVIDVSRAALDEEGRKPEAAAGEARGAGKSDSAKASAPAYVARIALETTTMTIEGHEEPLGPGMAVTVEIKTGRRRIIGYLLSPLRTYADESLRER